MCQLLCRCCKENRTRNITLKKKYHAFNPQFNVISNENGKEGSFLDHVSDYTVKQNCKFTCILPCGRKFTGNASFSR